MGKACWGVVMAALAVGFVGMDANAVSVSSVKEGRMCALSFTYDDGVETHYTHALPMHLKYKLPGTFLIITSRVENDDANRAHKCCSWNELKEMSDKGMEIASHTKSHINMREIESDGVTREMTAGKKRDEIFKLREKNWPRLLSEVVDSKKEIEDHIGKEVRTYAFAGNACPDWTGRLMGEVKGVVRVGNIRIASGRGDTAERYEKQIDEKIMVSNRVSCVMFHGLGTKTANDGWNPIPDLEVYESIFRLVTDRLDKIYFATFAENAIYEALAKSVQLKKSADGSFTLAYRDPKRQADGKEVWLRVDEGEKVSVNGVAAVPNKYGAVSVKIGDVVIVK